jgi:hypothetical protein
MVEWDFHNKQISVAVLVLITVLNVGLVINFLMVNSDGTNSGLNGVQIYILVALELACVFVAYVGSKRRNTAESF